MKDSYFVVHVDRDQGRNRVTFPAVGRLQWDRPEQASRTQWADRIRGPLFSWHW